MHYNLLVIHDENTAIEQLMEPYDIGLEKDYDADARCWYNPLAFYDWYTIGGRWSKCLRLKDNKEFTSSDYMKNIDFDFNWDAAEKAADFWDSYVLKGETPEEYNSILCNRNYYMEKYISKDFFVALEGIFWYPRVMTPDGKFHSLIDEHTDADVISQIKWAQSFYDTYISRYYSCYNPDKCTYMMTMVDYHI